MKLAELMLQAGAQIVALHATQRLWKQGRNFGIGGSLISQRPQDVSKKVLEMTGTMFAFETTGPNAKKAIAGWMDAHDIDESVADVLPTLKQGEPYVWSPTFLKVQRVVVILPKETADVSSTPKVGSRTKERPLTPIDVEQLQTAMAATIEKAKADDPRELRKIILDLKKQLAARGNELAAAERQPIREGKSKPVLTDADRALLSKLADGLGNIREFLQATPERLANEARTRIVKLCEIFIDDAKNDFVRMSEEFERRMSQRGFQKILEKLGTVQPLAGRREESTSRAPLAPAPAPRADLRSRVRQKPSPRRSASVIDDSLTGPEQRILDAIAWLETLGITEPEQTAVAFLAGYTYGGGAFNNPRGSLKVKGLVQYCGGGDRIALTETGRELAHVPAQPLTTEELHARVLDRLPGPEQRILVPLLQAYPQALADDVLATQAGYTAGAGAFNNPKGRLRSLGLIDYPQPRHAAARGLLFL